MTKMIKSIIFALLVIAIVAQDQGPVGNTDGPNIPEYDVYLLMYPSKQYTTEEYDLRKSIYVGRTQKWRQLTFNYPEVNRYTDWTDDEIKNGVIVKMATDDNIAPIQMSQLQLNAVPASRIDWTLIPSFPTSNPTLDIGCKPSWATSTIDLLQAAQFCIANQTVQLSTSYMIYCSINATTRAGFLTTPGQTQAQAAFNFLFDQVCLNETFRTIDQALAFGLAGVPLNSQLPYDGNNNGIADITQLGPVPSCDLATYPSNVKVNGITNKLLSLTELQLRTLISQTPIISTLNLAESIHYGSGGFAQCFSGVSDTFAVILGYTNMRFGRYTFPIYIVKPNIDDSFNNNGGYINIHREQRQDCNIGDTVYYIGPKTSAINVQAFGSRVMAGLVVALILAILH